MGLLTIDATQQAMAANAKHHGACKSVPGWRADTALLHRWVCGCHRLAVATGSRAQRSLDSLPELCRRVPLPANPAVPPGVPRRTALWWNALSRSHEGPRSRPNSVTLRERDFLRG